MTKEQWDEAMAKIEYLKHNRFRRRSMPPFKNQDWTEKDLEANSELPNIQNISTTDTVEETFKGLQRLLGPDNRDIKNT